MARVDDGDLRRAAVCANNGRAHVGCPGAPSGALSLLAGASFRNVPNQSDTDCRDTDGARPTVRTTRVGPLPRICSRDVRNPTAIPRSTHYVRTTSARQSQVNLPIRCHKTRLYLAFALRQRFKMPYGMPMRDKEIMEKLFDLKKLTSSEISFVLGCSVQVVQKRRREYEANGTITAVKEMSWQKIKLEHREVGRLLPSRVVFARRRTQTGNRFS